MPTPSTNMQSLDGYQTSSYSGLAIPVRTFSQTFKVLTNFVELTSDLKRSFTASRVLAIRFVVTAHGHTNPPSTRQSPDCCGQSNFISIFNLTSMIAYYQIKSSIFLAFLFCLPIPSFFGSTEPFFDSRNSLTGGMIPNCWDMRKHLSYLLLYYKV